MRDRHKKCGYQPGPRIDNASTYGLHQCGQIGHLPFPGRLPDLNSSKREEQGRQERQRIGQ